MYRCTDVPFLDCFHCICNVVIKISATKGSTRHSREAPPRVAEPKPCSPVCARARSHHKHTLRYTHTEKSQVHDTVHGAVVAFLSSKPLPLLFETASKTKTPVIRNSAHSPHRHPIAIRIANILSQTPKHSSMRRRRALGSSENRVSARDSNHP